MHTHPLAALALALALAACSPQQLHHTGTAWRRSLCDKRIGDDRTRCESEASRSDSEYRPGDDSR